MMMALGLFVFELRTAPYETLERHTAWRHASHEPVGARPRSQYLGPGDDTINLSGTLYPALTGGRATLDLLRVMAEQGQGWPLIEGTGRIFGHWAITEIRETTSRHMRDGAPQRIDFTIGLRRVDDTRLDLLGVGTNAMLAMATGVAAGAANRVRDAVAAPVNRLRSLL